MCDQNTESVADPLSQLVGRELSAVVFVRDYLQLQFDGPLLTITSSVVARIADSVFRMEEPGFKDALVGQIGHTVAGTRVCVDEAISITFSGDREILISLLGADL